jgi:Zn-dependent protease with chaperone function
LNLVSFLSSVRPVLRYIAVSLCCHFESVFPMKTTVTPWSILTATALSVMALFASPAGAQPANAADDGIKGVGKMSAARKLVSAEQIEAQAKQQYAQLLQESASKRALAPADHPQLVRLCTIAQKLIPYSTKWNDRSPNWQWEVNLIGSQQINAFCMPGGKIAFYTGILDQLKLTDDEVALVMGHEIAHALREHGR